MGAGVVGFEEGESQEKISVEVLADEVNDPWGGDRSELWKVTRGRNSG